MNLEPTSEGNIFCTQWFTDPKHPLIENKIYYSKADDLLYYITAHRGPTTDDIPASLGVVKGVTLADQTGFEDTSTDCFNTLVAYLKKPL